MKTFTKKQLNNLAAEINKALYRPAAPWTKGDDAPQANIGNFYVASDFGGVSLQEVVNKGGGTFDVFGIGYMSKRELFGRMQAYLKGIIDGRV